MFGEALWDVHGKAAIWLSFVGLAAGSGYSRLVVHCRKTLQFLTVICDVTEGFLMDLRPVLGLFQALA